MHDVDSHSPYYVPIMCILCAYYVLIMCILYAYYMHIICILYAYYVHSMCILCAYYMHIMCILCAYFVHIMCILCACYVHIMCILCASVGLVCRSKMSLSFSFCHVDMLRQLPKTYVTLHKCVRGIWNCLDSMLARHCRMRPVRGFAKLNNSKNPKKT